MKKIVSFFYSQQAWRFSGCAAQAFKKETSLIQELQLDLIILEASSNLSDSMTLSYN